MANGQFQAMGNERIRIAIVARTPELRDALSSIVSAHEALSLTAIAKSADELEEIASDIAIDAVLSERRAALSDPSPLTGRETEILALLAGGLSNKEIARLLGISFHTVKFHVASMLDKLDADSRVELVTKAARLGLVMI